MLGSLLAAFVRLFVVGVRELIISGHERKIGWRVGTITSIDCTASRGVTTIDLGDSEPLDENGSRRSLLLRGAYFGDLARVVDCLNRNVDVNHRDERGCSALRYAAGQGHVEIVEYLLEAGAGKDDEMEAIIKICEIRGHSKVLEKIKNGA